jgi:hypothetical protein
MYVQDALHLEDIVIGPRAVFPPSAFVPFDTDEVELRHRIEIHDHPRVADSKTARHTGTASPS